MITPMTKFTFLLLSGDRDSFLSELEGLGVVDITRSAKPIDERSERMLSEAERLAKAVSYLEGCSFDKDLDAEKIKAATTGPLPEDLCCAVEDAKASLQSLESRISAVTKEQQVLSAWGSFNKSKLEALSALGYKFHWFKSDKKHFDPSWEQTYPLQVISEEGSDVFFVVVSEGEGPLEFPIAELPEPSRDIKAAEDELKELAGDLIACKGKLNKLKEGLPALKAQRVRVLGELDHYLADCGATEAVDNQISIFTGFAPDADAATLCGKFDTMPLYYIKESATVEDNPPIKLKNNWFTRMFTVLTDMYGRPEYTEFDPTPYISVFFLLFFAMCMGDAGYGLLLIILGIVLKKSEGMKDLSPLVTTLGVGTLVIGIVMHTAFGVDIYELSWIPAWMKKCMVTGTIAGFEANMVIALIIGVIHLCLAMVVKTVYATKNQGFLGSLGVWGWTLLIVGGVIVGALGMASIIPAGVLKWVVIALGVISAIGIFLLNDIHRNPLKNIGSGLWETYNTVTGLLGDVLSYLRLYALGLAGGMLGKAFNDIAAMTLGDGHSIIGWIPFILILVIGHALNFAMCCLGAFVHPLRLNFLEFFKNSGYSGKGRTYKPLSKEATI